MDTITRIRKISKPLTGKDSIFNIIMDFFGQTLMVYRGALPILPALAIPLPI
ncbi:hypothetical protein SPSIL_055390 [Sporomusa silvacetica DSM 10669]|uniref:Uncharacterized protein n=1 Tax=Sporomusa silvacetica DSM 10669 TaxID=1123289 RepID=A0ABZ3IUG7_9FIRM|nr:hypothetical protein SPSIL_12210 [Sporomusa silvacetica DSM 10669]